MRHLWWFLVVAACQGAGDDSYPIVPGGDDSPIVPAVDAAVPDGGGGSDAMGVSGRVCLVGDLRNLTLPACSGTNAGGLTVTIGAQTATTAPDGGFSLPAGIGANLVWRVTGPGIVPSTMRVGGAHVIPVVSEVVYADLLISNGVILQPDQGSIVMRVVEGAQPVPGAQASASPPASYDAFYDGPTAATWPQGATGPFGVIWLVGVPTGTALVAVLPPASATQLVTAQPVDDQAITFATVALP